MQIVHFCDWTILQIWKIIATQSKCVENSTSRDVIISKLSNHNLREYHRHTQTQLPGLTLTRWWLINDHLFRVALLLPCHSWLGLQLFERKGTGKGWVVTVLLLRSSHGTTMVRFEFDVSVLNACLILYSDTVQIKNKTGPESQTQIQGY